MRVSIHAPQAGSDATQLAYLAGQNSFNPRSPGGERRARVDIGTTIKAFQSTLPRRGATTPNAAPNITARFNPRSPGGERPRPGTATAKSAGFQSTLPRRGATLFYMRNGFGAAVSIHAPQAGSDALSQPPLREYQFQSTLPRRGATPPRPEQHVQKRFNPRSPGGERPPKPAAGRSPATGFNPRSPGGERPVEFGNLVLPPPVSIHAPQAGSDSTPS